MIKRITLISCIALMAFLFNANAGTNPGKPALAAYQLPANVTASDYMANTIIFRVKPEYRSYCSEQEINIDMIKRIFASLNVSSVKKIFPHHQPPLQETNEYGFKLVDLSLIYELHYSSQSDLVKSINQLLRTNIFLYAEPKFMPVLLYNPNDPQIGSQYFLTNINAFNAWNVSKGDTTVVIGITDTGTDTNHPDLAGNIKHNYADPVNGLDDDGDGYIDNFTGWDVAENDNDPQVGSCGVCSHGSHVSGCAAAVTDNGTGVASPGFKCKFLPVKIADPTGALPAAYQGIIYAADHGCQIINCSWGSTGGGSFGENAINYATINKNCLVVAAAGNNSSTEFFYPAAYENALAVAATNSADVKSPFSNFGTYVDVCSPGSAIFSTYFDDTYSAQSGTSMASPVAAGGAALIKSMNPSMTGMQVGQKLRVTADNIYSLNGNLGYKDLLGSGRINLYKSLTQTSPAVRIKNPLFTDNDDDVFIIGDTIRFSGDFFNFLDPTSVSLGVTLSSTSPYVTILDSTTALGVINTMSSVNNAADPFLIKINPNAPQNSKVVLKLRYVDLNYNDFETVDVTVNVDYFNITINDVLTTNTSKGRLGYNSEAQADGLGFNYQSNGTMLYEAGFMLGMAGIVSDNIRGDVAGSTDDDFRIVDVIRRNNPPKWSDFDTYGKFNDLNSVSPLGITVSHRSASWSQSPYLKFHIFEYTVKNPTVAALNGMYVGIFADWDIMDYTKNKIDEDLTLKMGYAYSTEANGLFAGIKLLTSGNFYHYGIDNITGGGGGLDLTNGFSDVEKFTTISSNRATAGGASTGNDIIDVVGTGPYNLATGDSFIVAFALIAGNNLVDIQESAQQAQIKYDLLTAIDENSTAELISLNPYPNPSNDNIIIPFYLRNSVNVSLSIYDVSGRLVISRSLGQISAGEQQLNISLGSLSDGLYHYRLSSEKGESSGLIQKQ